jgi:hypothetical protein
MSPRCVNACGKLPICSPVVRACLPRVAQRVEKPFAKVAKVALAAATVLLLVAVFPQLLAVLTLVTMAAIAVFIVLGQAVGHLLAGPDPGDSAALALSSALRHPGIALAIASGNSDGDLPMLQWTAADSGAGFTGHVHHTDAEREWAYDRTSRIGRLDQALDEANAKGWAVVDMKRDWKRVFPFEDNQGSQ